MKAKNFQKALIYISLFVVTCLFSLYLYTKTGHYKNLEARKYINCGVVNSGCDNFMDEVTNASTTVKTGVQNENVKIKQNTKPKIHSINKTSFTYGEKVEIRGENFYAFENDKIVILVNEKDEKIYVDTIWNEWHSYISFILPSKICTVLEGESGISDCAERGGKMINIEKGKYKIYFSDFETGEYSNSLEINII
jgi:hypothetical protein